jgi:DNA gyrase/topoisomerase IV subunit B
VGNKTNDPSEHVRTRVGMYFGSNRAGGLRALVMEVTANSIDEVLAGRADTVEVTIHQDGSATISDNGAGLGAAHDDPGAFVAEVLTSFRDTATADEHQPHVHLSFGTGLGPVCAACSRIEVCATTRTTVIEQVFACGKPVSAVLRASKGEPTGTTVRLWPDPEVFASLRWDVGLLQRELVPLAQLIPGLAIRFSVEPQTYGPVSDLVPAFEDVTGSRTTVGHGEPFLVSADQGANSVRLALGWVGHFGTPTIDSYCNLRPTGEGGSHVEGIEEGLRLVFGQGPTKELMKGLVGVLHVMLLEPNFAGPTKGRLDSPDAIWLVADAIAKQLPAQLHEHPELMTELQQRQLARRAGATNEWK